MPTYAEYWQEVRSLADACVAAFKDQETEEPNEWLWETCDSHQYVIYTAHAQEVLCHSPNDGYTLSEYGCDGIVKDGALNWSALAVGALYADVCEELARQDFDPYDPQVPEEAEPSEVEAA